MQLHFRLHAAPDYMPPADYMQQVYRAPLRIGGANGCILKKGGGFTGLGLKFRRAHEGPVCVTLPSDRPTAVARAVTARSRRVAHAWSEVNPTTESLTIVQNVLRSVHPRGHRGAPAASCWTD